MSLLNGSLDDDQSDTAQHSANGVGRNGKSQLKVVVSQVDNENGLNNNHDEYKTDMKTNGNSNEKVAEDDPLTGHKKWDIDGSGEAFQPRWAQRFATTNFFMVIFLLAYVLQGCYFTYFVSVITTIEKLFHIKSASIALLLNFSEIGQICTSLFLTYFAGRGHRPRWIACGMFLFSIAAFGSVSPHFLFGSKLYNHSAVMKSESDQRSMAQTSLMMGNSGIHQGYANSSLCLSEYAFSQLGQLDPSCNKNNDQDTTSNAHLQKVVLVILAVSLLGIGIGQTAIATLGIPYIDDNVKSKQSPLYMAITIGVRVLGPALGYYLGSLCVRLYVVPGMDVDHKDPNFIGAWWLGLLFVSTSMFFASLVMFTFPKNLRNKATQVLPAPTTKLDESTKTDKSANGSGKLDIDEIRPKSENFMTTIKRQLKNDILMFRTASAVLHLLPITGLYVFLPKYLEVQFQMPTHMATFVSGTFGILMMGVGILITGIISVKFSLSAKKVALWIAFTALATAFGMFMLSMIGCPMDNFKGLETHNDGIFGSSKKFVPPCGNFSKTCLCDTESFAPICGSDGFSYFSSCHAGCRVASEINSTQSFSECSCISVPETALPPKATVGLCDNDRCLTKRNIFVALFALTVFIHSTSEVGGMLIIMRCTHPKDKAMAMGIIQFSIGLLSNIPCPNIYARIIDATCIVWTKICGNNGHCSLYDSDSFRRYFFGVSCFIMLLAFVMDIVVYFKSHRIDIDPESHTVNEVNGGSTKDYGEENLLKLRSLQDVDDDRHMKIAIRDEI